MTERLEEIKEQLEDSNSYDDNPNGYWYHTIKWLIQQAERVKELEETNKKNYWIAADFKFENLKLEQQNQRYREALEEITSSPLGGSYTDVAEADRYQRIARKALEESE